MRILPSILIVTLTCTFIHESLHHEDGPGTVVTVLSHAGPDHHHDGHGHDQHDHPEDSEHDSDHHDEDSHDHQFRILIGKKDPSRFLRTLSSSTGIVNCHVSDIGQLSGVFNRIPFVSQRSNPPNPEYLCAHILLL